MLPLVELRSFAVERHAGQLYGELPYVVHLDEVFELVLRFGLGPLYERAAFGHDLLDDTHTTSADLVERFGSAESDLIYSVSGTGHNRTARRNDTIARLWRHPAGINLKLADRCANLANSLKTGKLALVKMYLSERPYYAPLFAQGHPLLQAELNTLYTQAEQVQGRRRLD